ncbi:hypothetical protein L7F22_063611 [Adiantum nelumboides]|nr:hypothetical protein [Adiantum nelumboides]
MGHSLTLLPSSPYPSNGFHCNLCHEQGCGPVYHCSDCDFDLHVSCAAMTIQHTHFAHPHHPLHLTPCGSRQRKCDSCGSGIHTWSFHCEPCDFDMHSVCARAQRFIMHPQHPHPLELIESANIEGPIQCSGCRKSVTNLFYCCRICRFNLHQVCATLPSRIKHVKHQAHMLVLIDAPAKEYKFWPTCRDCGHAIEGWRFHCRTCEFSLHPTCAKLIHELPHYHAEASHEANNATPSAVKMRTAPVHSLMPPFVSTISHAPANIDVPNNNDWEAVEKVLRFAQEMVKVTVPHAAESASSDHQHGEQDYCPTCLEGFDPTNPKKLTSCGHSFHLACILEWMERSSHCPICRSHIGIEL